MKTALLILSLISIYFFSNAQYEYLEIYERYSQDSLLKEANVKEVRIFQKIDNENKQLHSIVSLNDKGQIVYKQIGEGEQLKSYTINQYDSLNNKINSTMFYKELLEPYILNSYQTKYVYTGNTLNYSKSISNNGCNSSIYTYNNGKPIRTEKHDSDCIGDSTLYTRLVYKYDSLDNLTTFERYYRSKIAISKTATYDSTGRIQKILYTDYSGTARRANYILYLKAYSNNGALLYQDIFKGYKVDNLDFKYREVFDLHSGRITEKKGSIFSREGDDHVIYKYSKGFLKLIKTTQTRNKRITIKKDKVSYNSKKLYRKIVSSESNEHNKSKSTSVKVFQFEYSYY